MATLVRKAPARKIPTAPASHIGISFQIGNAISHSPSSQMNFLATFS